MVKRKYERTEGKNKRYGKQEQDVIFDEVYQFLKDNKNHELVNVFSLIKEDKEILDSQKHRDKNLNQSQIDVLTNTNEIRIDCAILNNVDLYQGIQKIYRNHGVEIPSQKTIDKGEVIDAKKRIIAEVFKFS